MAPKFQRNKKVMNKAPVWVTFPNLDLRIWTANGLSRLPSIVGTSLYANKYSACKDKISYTWILIEVNVSTTLRETVIVRDPFYEFFEKKSIMNGFFFRGRLEVQETGTCGRGLCSP